MTDIASIIPDTATVPVAQDLVHPTSQQNGHESLAGAASPLNSSVSSRRSAGLESPPNHVMLNGKLRSDSAAQELEAKQNGLEPLSLKHLPNVETRFYCAQAHLSIDFHCRMDALELN